MTVAYMVQIDEPEGKLGDHFWENCEVFKNREEAFCKAMEISIENPKNDVRVIQLVQAQSHWKIKATEEYNG